ncbi:unnamed protein product, partial [Prorocentrum cordatum]
QKTPAPQVTFPHDAAPPAGERCPAAEAADELARQLEALLGGAVDASAQGALEALGSPERMREAARRVEVLARGQGGRCGSLSAMVLGVCHKLRPTDRAAPMAELSDAALGDQWLGHPRGDPRAAFVLQRGAPARQTTTWTTSRFERHSRQGGAFELRQAEGGLWDLRLAASDLEPPLNDDGVQVYCRWLHQRLKKAKEECGLSSLRQLRAELDFSKNGLGDDALERLLQALQRAEVQVTSLNLMGNCIGPAGVQHLCDFLKGASFAVRELHLSHNMLDDDASLHMIRLFSEHPKYPTSRPRGSSGASVTAVPVWLSLHNNWIRDPARVLREARAELGASACLAQNRHACGPDKCGWRGAGSPAVHLYAFDIQDVPVAPPGAGEDAGQAPRAAPADQA